MANNNAISSIIFAMDNIRDQQDKIIAEIKAEEDRGNIIDKCRIIMIWEDEIYNLLKEINKLEKEEEVNEGKRTH